MENHSSPAFFVHNFALAITKKRWLREFFLPSFFDLLIQTNTTLFPISPQKEEGNTPDAKTNENQMRITKSLTL